MSVTVQTIIVIFLGLIAGSAIGASSVLNAIRHDTHIMCIEATRDAVTDAWRDAC